MTAPSSTDLVERLKRDAAAAEAFETIPAVRVLVHRSREAADTLTVILSERDEALRSRDYEATRAAAAMESANLIDEMRVHAEAQLAAMREALETIARQKLIVKMTPEDLDGAPFDDAYEMCVHCARAALSRSSS